MGRGENLGRTSARPSPLRSPISCHLGQTADVGRCRRQSRCASPTKATPLTRPNGSPSRHQNCLTHGPRPRSQRCVHRLLAVLRTRATRNTGGGYGHDGVLTCPPGEGCKQPSRHSPAGRNVRAGTLPGPTRWTGTPPPCSSHHCHHRRGEGSLGRVQDRFYSAYVVLLLVVMPAMGLSHGVPSHFSAAQTHQPVGHGAEMVPGEVHGHAGPGESGVAHQEPAVEPLALWWADRASRW